jgi:hypothetical protein
VLAVGGWRSGSYRIRTSGKSRMCLSQLGCEQRSPERTAVRIIRNGAVLVGVTDVKRALEAALVWLVFARGV